MQGVSDQPSEVTMVISVAHCEVSCLVRNIEQIFCFNRCLTPDRATLFSFVVAAQIFVEKVFVDERLGINLALEP